MRRATLPSPLPTALLVGLVLLAGACRGPCERLCVNLATYAEECGFTVPEGELDACIDGQKGASGDDKQVCREYGDPAVLRNEWTCDDLQAYWDGGDGGETTR
jgi:hypothetical protein